MQQLTEKQMQEVQGGFWWFFGLVLMAMGIACAVDPGSKGGLP